MRSRTFQRRTDATHQYNLLKRFRRGDALRSKGLITLFAVNPGHFVKGSFLPTARFGEKENSAFSPDLTRPPESLVKGKESIQYTRHLGKVLSHGSWRTRWPLAVPWSNAQPALTRPELVWSATLAVPLSLTLVPYPFTMRVRSA